MRIASMIGVALAGLLLSSCATGGNFIGDNLPEWAGGLPPDAPPRPGAPGYRAYMRQVDGNETDKAVPAVQAQAAAPAIPPPNKPQGTVDQPIH